MNYSGILQTDLNSPNLPLPSRVWPVRLTIVTAGLTLWWLSHLHGLLFFLLLVSAVITLYFWGRYRRFVHFHAIENTPVPGFALRAYQRRFSAGDLSKMQLVERGWRDFLLIVARAQGAVAMPSQAVDELWHLLLTDPVQYETYCKKVLGKVLEHAPHTGQTSAAAKEAQWMRAWGGSCVLREVDPRHPVRLPLLFALDAVLNWPQPMHTVTAGEFASRYTAWKTSQTGGSDSSYSSSSGCSSGDSGCGGDGGGCGGD